MSLAHGREYLAIPGPSVIPDRVLRAMHRASPNIYHGPIEEMTHHVAAELKQIAGTSGDVAMYIANGHGAWEAAISNILKRGDKMLVLGTGRFAPMWGVVAGQLGAKVDVLDFGKHGPVDPARVEDHLRADKTHEIKAVLVAHVDTATSVKNDIRAIRAALDAAGHPALLLADCMASLACDEYHMDSWGADLTVAGCQKGLMTPPGLGFVFFNERAAQARARADAVTAYWDWLPRSNPTSYYMNFFGTAPTHHLFGLNEALAMIREEGLTNTWARHATLARAVWAAFDAWGLDGPMRLNIEDPAYRSNAVTAARLVSPDGTRLRDWVEQKAGVTLGIGLGMADPGDPASDAFFRLGHMGHLNAHMVLGVLGVIEAGLTALDIPHGSGALEAAATVCASA